jgi:hypothetical protein
MAKRESGARQAVRMLIAAGAAGVDTLKLTMLDEKAGKPVNKFDDRNDQWRRAGRLPVDYLRVEMGIKALADAGYVLRRKDAMVILEGYSTVPANERAEGPPKPCADDFDLAPTYRLLRMLELAGRRGTYQDNMIYWEQESREIIHPEKLRQHVEELARQGWKVELVGGNPPKIRLVETPAHPMLRGADVPLPG